jgi:acyl carrier protein
MANDLKLKEILETVLELNPNEYSEEISTENNEKWDSIKHLLLMSTLEQEFDISFDDEDLLNLTSFKNIKKRLEDA